MKKYKKGTAKADFKKYSDFYKKLSSSNIGKFNNELASEEVQIFNKLAGAELNRFGYLI
jgi:hypothetical protein